MPQLDLINFFRIIFFISFFLILISVYFLYIIRYQYLRIQFFINYFIIEILKENKIVGLNMFFFKHSLVFFKNYIFWKKQQM